jgi:dTDP-4-dehydrorhamnose 3,5-epimerase
MKKIDLKKLRDPIKLQTRIFYDSRGYFQEVFRKNNFGLDLKFTAIAFSKKNVIRGMHFQLKNKQNKFLYVVDGRILDVVINLNKRSKNFGKVYKFYLNPGEIIFVPDNYAHGYECLSSKCTVFYHLEKYRDARNESGIKYNDETLNIKWKTKKPILSLRDQNHMSFLDFKKIYKSL